MQFKDIIGQDKIKKRLINTVKDNRISHAQLFLGHEGSGKLALAIAYAQYISCKDKQNNDSCGKCSSCIQYNKLIHPDLHFAYPVAPTKKYPKHPVSEMFLEEWRKLLTKTNYYPNLNDWYKEIDIEKKQGIISAEDCNEIIKTLSLKPYESEYKVMIIWMAEKIFHSAAPKILKILEEPSDKTLFILISENQDKIISTILSRTQIIKIPKISDIDLQNALINKANCTNREAKRVAAIADGNAKRALELINTEGEDDFIFIKFRDWMRMCLAINKNIVTLNNFINEISIVTGGRERQKELFSYALRTIRECLLSNYENNNLEKLEGEELIFIQKFSSFINSKNAVQLTEEFNKASFHIERNANPKIVFMDLSLTVNKLLSC